MTAGGWNAWFARASRTIFERALEHKKQMDKMDLESPLVEHHLNHHKDIPKTDYKLELVRAFRCPLERQTYEGYLIASSKAIAINIKGEWGQTLPPKFICTDGSAPINRPKTIQRKRGA